MKRGKRQGKEKKMHSRGKPITHSEQVRRSASRDSEKKRGSLRHSHAWLKSEANVWEAICKGSLA